MPVSSPDITRIIKTAVPDDLAAAVHAHAKDTDRTVAGYVRYVLRQHFADLGAGSTPQERAEQAHAAGAR
jgi:hypothetical protein